MPPENMLKSALRWFFFLFTSFVMVIPKRITAQNLKDSIPEKYDYVELNNGTRIFGEILYVSRTKLFFDGDKTGNVKIGLENIRHLKAQSKLYRIEFYPQGKYVGKIDFTETPGMGRFISSVFNDSFQYTNIISLHSFEEKFWKTLKGDLQLGYSYTKSSNITRFNFSNRLTYYNEKWDVKENFSGIYTIGDGDGFERIEASLDGLYALKERLKWLNRVQYQRMLELGISSRIIVTTGIGKRIWQTRNLEFDLGTGLALQREYSVNKTNRFGAEIPVFVSFNIFEIKKPDIDVFNTSMFYYSLTVPGRYRADFRLQTNYEVFKDFLIGTQIFYNYDSKPFSVNASTSDFGIVFTLGYKF